MSRKITNEAIDAFLNAQNWRSGNTQVGNIDLLNTDMYLFGNLIARRNKETKEIFITNSGWQSDTTKERLNSIPGVSICQKNRVWYLNGEKWDGGWIKVS